MNFCWVTLPVKDMEASLAFYHGVLGLPIDSRIGPNVVMLGEPSAPKVELLHEPGSEGKTFHSDMTVGVGVKSLEEAMELLAKHDIPIVRGPISPAPNIRFLFVHDPDGYQVQLVEQRG